MKSKKFTNREDRRLSGSIAMFAVLGLVGIISSQVRAKKSDGVVDFGPSPAILILLIALSSFFLIWFAVYLFRYPFDIWRLPILVAALAGFFGIPADITVTPESVREKFWWRRETIILWKDVESINYKTASGGIQIKGIKGERITHSKGNRDPFEFELTCMRYTAHATAKLARRKKRSQS